MNSLATAPGLSVHDPVAAAIERHLRRLKATRRCKLNADQRADGVYLSFGKAIARAENYDIALVRLGQALLEDEEFRGPLIAALSGHVAHVD
jgi:hypothetical protein